MNPKSTWWKRLGGKRGAVPAHARSAALAFAGPQGATLEELLEDATGRGAHRYAPSTVAWMQAQYEATLAQAEDCRTDAVQALDAEAQLRVRAADMRHWLLREAGVSFDEAEPLRNGEYFPSAEADTAEQGRSDVTAFYAQQPPDEVDEDVPLYGHRHGAPSEPDDMAPRGVWAPAAEPAGPFPVAYDRVVLGGAR